MKRRLFGLALALIPATAADSEFNVRLARFHRHYDAFTRAYLGCPAGARVIEECELTTGTFDYQEFNAARREARKLFQ